MVSQAGKVFAAYKNAQSRVKKSIVISDIVASIRESSTTGGGFVRYDLRIERWYEVGDKVARDKVGQCLRALNSHKQQRQAKETVHNNHSPRSSEASPTVDLKPQPISSFGSTQGLPVSSTKRTSGGHRPPDYASSPIYETTMTRSSIPTQSRGKQRISDSSDDSTPSDNSLFAWFEADSREAK